ncbi:MAG: aspartate--tRNA(Asn) ligase [Candidatus Poseidoniaceae archaeon]|nr:aspartate--tRNA(Asn) ligase [Candidatus Poseidoniaceae archaeon]
MATWVPTAYRTHTLGEIQQRGSELLDQEVTVSGFMEANRGKGAICFVDLRDGTGTTQVFLKKDNIGEDELDMVQRMTRESTLQFTGIVSQKRPPKVKEGEPVPPPAYEVIASSVHVIARAEAPLPLGVTDTVHVALDTRLDNRFLDLRRTHVNAMFHLRGKILQYGREALIQEGFFETHTPKIVATATEGGTDLFPMMYFDTPAFLNQSPQLYKQLCMSGGLERVFEVGPAFRAEKHDTYRHLNEFISFDIECSWANDEDVMGVLERMIHHMWKSVAEDAESQAYIHAINDYRATQGEEPIEVIVPELPFPRLSYCDAIETIQRKGGTIEWGDDIDAENSDLLAEDLPQFYFLPRWPMDLKPFYIHHVEGEDGSTGRQLSRGFDLNFGRDELTSGGQREHRMDVLIENLKAMDLNPEEFEFYVAGFRHGVPPHAGWGLGVERILMKLTGAKNVRETVLFPRDRRRVSP